MKNTFTTLILTILIASSVFAAADLANFPNMFIEDGDADADEELMRKHVRSMREVALRNIEAIV